jgi:hypothetical protein
MENRPIHTHRRHSPEISRADCEVMTSGRDIACNDLSLAGPRRFQGEEQIPRIAQLGVRPARRNHDPGDNHNLVFDKEFRGDQRET